MGCQTPQDGPSGVRSEERHHVAGADRHVEAVLDARRGEVEFGEVGNQPRRTWMILLGSCNEHGIEVDTDDIVSHPSEMSSDPTRPTSRVENP